MREIKCLCRIEALKQLHELNKASQEEHFESMVKKRKKKNSEYLKEGGKGEQS